MGASAQGFDIERAGIGVLAEAFPLETVRAILKATKREGQRRRLLPAPMMVYYVIALGLFVGVGCRDVLRGLLDGAGWIWPGRLKIATDSAITQARQRLGCEPIETLYQGRGDGVRPSIFVGHLLHAGRGAAG
ncbi:MAG: transposase domain-containing protein [Thermoanaerobaculia bacterium]